MEPLIQLTDVSKSYRYSDDAEPVQVLRHISLQIPAGQSVSIVGPSGSGKSTLLNLLGALDRPSEGRVEFDGQDISQLDDQQLAEFRNQKLGFVFQSHHLLPYCSVLENVLVPTLAKCARVAPAKALDRARYWLDRVGLAHRLGHRPGQLSGGERQRTAVVRALINEPKLLLADEPTGALDQASAEGLAQLLVDLNKEAAVTLVVVTHSQELAARMSRQLTMRDGILHAHANA